MYKLPMNHIELQGDKNGEKGVDGVGLRRKRRLLLTKCFRPMSSASRRSDRNIKGEDILVYEPVQCLTWLDYI
ncbi:hypothetical protein Y032_0100g3292 [Ancylostoma ceylanicum]|uniref:Uncharacterized protein n=1 Tax=Ancylostoma ceylanicum TaxID=53326 RepID=A0A016THG5_9BILA|nr:hypothetical protein Y032_0100g3292 [Ancylostoma ceylanicum]